MLMPKNASHVLFSGTFRLVSNVNANPPSSKMLVFLFLQGVGLSGHLLDYASSMVLPDQIFA